MEAHPELELDDRVIDAIARRVVKLLQRPSDVAEWLTAEQVARRYNVSRRWVYDHAHELGAQRLGRGTRARLRFSARTIQRYMAPPADTPVPQAQGRPSDRAGRGLSLLPIDGD